MSKQDLIKKVTSKEILNIQGETFADELADDFTYARSILRDMAEKGKEGVSEMQEIAWKSEEPRSYEVLAGLIKTTVSAAEKLMNTQKAATDIAKIRDGQVDQANVNIKSDNVVFVGTTTDLQRQLLGDPNIIDAEGES